MPNKTHLISFIAGLVVGLSIGFVLTKCHYDKPINEKIETDTIVVYKTIPDYHPNAKDSTLVKWKTKWLPLYKTDTVDRLVEEINFLHDTVAVEVPITSKHYSGKNYDAYVSGFEPKLDSVFIYNETQLITKTITRTVKDNRHFFLDVGAGCEYKFNDKSAVPFAELGLKFKAGRFGFGAYGGYSHDINENKGLPYGKAKISYDIISF